MNKGIASSQFGPLADSEDDIEKEIAAEKQKRIQVLEEKKQAKIKAEMERKLKEEAEAKKCKVVKIKTPFDNLMRVSK